MAKAAETKTLERIYNIPLRREYLKVPRWKRTKKAVVAVKEFLVRHMKSPDVKLEKELNHALWHHGIRNPPHYVKVTVRKDEKGIVRAALFGVEEKGSSPEKKEKKATAEEKK